MSAVVALVPAIAMPAAGSTVSVLSSPNMLNDGGFEVAPSCPGLSCWTASSALSGAQLVWDSAVARNGARSARIRLDGANNAMWSQRVQVQPHSTYVLSGWVRTERVTHTTQQLDAGAHLEAVLSTGAPLRSGGVFGTSAVGPSGWTAVSLTFDSAADTQITVAASLGTTGANTTGLARFDDLSLRTTAPTPLGNAVFTWGTNDSGQLGNPNVSQQTSPAQLGAATEWAMIGGSGDRLAPYGNGSYTVAIKADGTLWSWGSNKFARLGTGDGIDHNTPTQIGSANNWKTISVGPFSTMAIKTDGTLWGWGANYSGNLGTGDTTTRTTPTEIGTATDWKAVHAGSYHTIAIKTDSTLWTWGENDTGDLGTGDNNNRNTPTQIGAATWAMVAAGGGTSLAIKADGTLWAWGWNYYGQLGTGDNTDKNTLTQVGSATDWVTVDDGGSHTLAIKTDGTLWGWGLNTRGELGLGDTTNRNTPTRVGTATNWKTAEAGESTEAIKTDGTLWGWGDNRFGQLGTGNTVSRTTPIQIGTGTGWMTVEMGFDHTVALRAAGST